MSGAWADDDDDDDYDDYDDVETYRASKVIGENGGTIKINKNAKIKIPENALKAYLDEQGLEEVEITVELLVFEDLDALALILGPSGAYFVPELKLILKGDYAEDYALLVDEDGNELPHDVKSDGDKIVYYVPHFSVYSFDDFDWKWYYWYYFLA